MRTPPKFLASICLDLHWQVAQTAHSACLISDNNNPVDLGDRDLHSREFVLETPQNLWARLLIKLINFNGSLVTEEAVHSPHLVISMLRQVLILFPCDLPTAADSIPQ